MSSYPDYPVQIPATFNFAGDVVDHLAQSDNRTALIWTNANGAQQQFSYADITRESSRLADVLIRNGIVTGDRVIVLFPRIPSWQIAMVACLRIGAVPVPCIEMLTEADVAYRVANSGARCVVTTASNITKFTSCMDQLDVCVALDGGAGWIDMAAAMGAARSYVPPVRVEAEAPAILYYTSGSSGPPKGVLHAARSLFAWRLSAKNWLDLKVGDVIWCTADTGWSKAGTSILFGPWSMGATVLFYDGPFDSQQRIALLNKYHVTVFCAAATEFHRLCQLPGPLQFNTLRKSVSAGEAVSAEIGSRWRDLTGLGIDEAYGQTETLMTVGHIAGRTYPRGSMGEALPGSSVAVIDDIGGVAAVGQIGQIAIALPNPQLMAGYWHDDERSSVCILDGRWFLTGDLASSDAAGCLYYAGRNDDIISSSGYRIGPAEVENVLLGHDAVLECAVVGRPDVERGEIVVAFVVLKSGEASTSSLAEQLKAFTKSKTAPYKYPRDIVFVSALPKSAVGKILRRVLKEQFC